MVGLRHGDWHLISEQRFRQRAGLEVVPQKFRDAPYIVICDALTSQYLRLNGRAQLLWDRLDGRSTIHEIWRALAALPGGIAPDQSEIMEWILQLSSLGFILSDHEIDPQYLAKRSQAKRDSMLEAKAMSPLAIRIALFDPLPIVKLLYPIARPLFSKAGGVCLCLLLLLGLVTGAMNLAPLLGASSAAFLSQSGLLAMLLAYPVMKGLHELGHALALYHYGRESREAGVMLLLFFPVPYVDATASLAIPSPKARMLVSAAGMIVELAMAATALLLWQEAEPGLAQAMLYSFIIMGTVSSLAFNGNPLLKFDAYYVLADWLEIPNLAQRASALLQDRFLALCLGLRPTEPALPKEVPILLVYGAASLIYRLFLTFVIVAAVAQMFFVLGIVLAFWSLTSSILWPLIKTIKKGREMAQAENARRRVGLRVGLILGGLLAAGGLLPLPFSATGQGQLIARPEAEVRAGAAGFVIAQSALTQAAPVKTGDVILQLAEPTQDERLAGLELSLAEVGTRLAAAGLSAAERRVYLARQGSIRENHALLAQEVQRKTIRGQNNGQMHWVQGQPPPQGAYLQRGDLIGFLHGANTSEAVISLAAHYIGVLPADGAFVELRLSDGTQLAGHIRSRRLFSADDPVPAALLRRNGGALAESQSKPGHTLGSTLALWLALDDDSPLPGQSLEAKIKLEPKPLFAQLVFHIERIFLRVMRL